MIMAGNLQITRTITLLITIFSLSLPAYAKYSGGTGEPNHPYQIATAEDLILLGEIPEDYDKHFILTADIDLDPNLPGRRVFDRAVIAPDVNDNEIWFQGIAFTGVFDGNGHTISHLTIDGTGGIGFFGRLESTAEVKNLGVVDVNITGSYFHVGGLAGSNVGNITMSYSTGTIGGNNQTGGLVGCNEGSITASYSSSTVTGDEEVGGFVGINFGSINACHSSVTVTGRNNIGGLVGENGQGSVTTSFSHSAVTGNGGGIGGLIGFNHGGSITTSYSSGTVTGGSVVGGLVGYHAGNITMSYWDIEVSNEPNMCGERFNYIDCENSYGKTTAEMKQQSTFEGWDFVGETENGTDDIWKILEGQDYPRLWWEKYSGGTGEPNDPYQIATIADLMLLGDSPEDYDRHFKLMADIDLSGYSYDKAVIAPDVNDVSGFQGLPFTGLFDGNGHAISHLTIEGGGYLGLFGQLESTAKVRNLGVVDANITGSYNRLGCLAGNNAGSIVASYSTGTITGESCLVGGLVGNNAGSIATSYSNCTVAGKEDVGGIAGQNPGSITNSYNIGTVTGGWDSIGGLVGQNDGSITTSYNAGTVNGPRDPGGLVHIGDPDSVSRSFWDMETSGLLSSNGGIGKTTTEMQTAATFLESGWDFMDEIDNGIENIWWILEGRDYPRLWWEASDL